MAEYVSERLTDRRTDCVRPTDQTTETGEDEVLSYEA